MIKNWIIMHLTLIKIIMKHEYINDWMKLEMKDKYYYNKMFLIKNNLINIYKI